MWLSLSRAVWILPSFFTPPPSSRESLTAKSLRSTSTTDSQSTPTNGPKFCAERARKYGVNFVLRKVTVPSGGAGFEAEARQLRYAVLEEEAKKAGADAILTAHHLDDQLETFLIQWMRGAGPAGLAAMPPLLRKDGCTIMRPLLGFQKGRAGTFCRKSAASNGSRRKQRRYEISS